MPTRPTSLGALRLQLQRSRVPASASPRDSGTDNGSIPPSPPGSDSGAGIGIPGSRAVGVATSTGDGTEDPGTPGSDEIPLDFGYREAAGENQLTETSVSTVLKVGLGESGHERRHMVALRALMPSITTSSLQELASAMLQEPRTLKKAFVSTVGEGVTSREMMLTFICEVFGYDVGNIEQMTRVTSMTDALFAPGAKIDYRTLEAELKQLSTQAPGTSPWSLPRPPCSRQCARKPPGASSPPRIRHPTFSRIPW